MEEKRVKYFSLYGQAIFITNIWYKFYKNCSLICLHENEYTAYESALEICLCEKIPFTYLKSSGSRNIVFKTQNGSIEIDPNRIWTDKGIENLLISDKNANDVIALLKEIRKTIIGFILDNSINSIISVHNNYNKNFNILAYYHNPVYSYVAENIHINKNISSGNFYYVTMRQDFETLKELNYNVVLQKPYNAFFDDGSLSIYCSINNIRYINVESNFNDYNIQKQMISKAIELTS